MRRIGVVLMILGLILALFAAGLVYFLLPRPAQPVLEPTTSLVVAFQDIPERTEIGSDQLGKVDWPQHVPTPIGAFGNTEAVTGKLALTHIYAGQPIIDKVLVDKDKIKETKSNAALVLEPQTLAIALPVSMDTSVAEAVEAGDRVDVIATFTLQPISGTQRVENVGPPVVITQRILQDVLILQVGPWPHQATATQAQSSSSQPTNTTIVTFQVPMQDALVVKYVQGQAGYFTLALRAANDHTIFNPTPVTIDYLKEHYGIAYPTPGR